MVVDNDGKATIFIPVISDNLTEGSEDLTVAVSNVSVGITINDTSLSPLTFFDSAVSNDSKVKISRIDDVTRIEGNQENNTLVGTEAIDKLSGGGGSDRFYSSKGNDAVDGGDGMDAVNFKGKSSDFRVQKAGLNWIVRDTRSDSSINQGEDILTAIERIGFEDKVLALDIDGAAGKAYRVYKAAFARDPMAGDQAGLGFWINSIDKGMDMVEVAARFIDSPEFRKLYGQNPSNAEFLTKVYTNVLGRTPDQGGYDWWLNQLNTNPEKTRQKVLADFAEIQENKEFFRYYKVVHTSRPLISNLDYLFADGTISLDLTLSKKNENKMELLKINPQDFGLTDETALNISQQFQPMLNKMVELEGEFNEIVQLPVEDKETSKKAKELRIKYVKLRTATAEIHKQQKSFYLNGGRFVDGWKNAQVFASQGKEEKLEAIEKYAENKEKERIEAIHNQRVAIISKYMEVGNVQFGTMDEDVWNAYLVAKKQAYETLLEAENKAQEERRQKELEEAKERDRIRIENERLRFEAEAIRHEAENEKLRQLDILRRQEIEKRKIEKELNKIKEAEAKAEAERIAKEKEEKKKADKLAKAPLKKQMNVWVDSFEIPKFSSDNDVSKSIESKFLSFKKWAKAEIENL